MLDSIDWRELLDRFDWQGFFAWPTDASVWSVLNSPILVTFLAALIGWRLNRRVSDAEAKADGVIYAFKGEQAELALEEDEPSEGEKAAEATTESQPDFRSQAAGLYDAAVAVLDGVIKAADGRHRRTYAAVKGTGLAALATAMLERQDLAPSQYQGAVEIAHEWNQYRRGRAARKVVPKSAFDKMRRSLAKLRDE
jgi:hypothetical protein